ncbi:hypothetical protein QIA31_05635 (plasmid) [Borreliella turdi]|uniref:hypothetical protein n=1 Tax=Borreliella turdi TaxID=57863 RepID=UPI003AEF3100
MNKVLIFNNDTMITFIIGALGTTMLIYLITIFIVYTIIKPNIIEKFKFLTINLQKTTKKLEEIEKRIEKLESKSQKAELDKTVKKSINLYKLKNP